MRSHPNRSNIARVRAAALVALLALGCSPPRGDSVAAIGAAELAERIQSGSAPLILDVRSEDEYASGHIPGAINIPHDALGERLDEIRVAKSDEIVVHCHSGRRAELAEAVLLDAGYSNLLDLEGHMEGWSSGGYPVESE